MVKLFVALSLLAIDQAHGPSDGQALAQAHGRTDGQAIEQAPGRADGQAIEQAHGRADGQAIEQAHGRADGQALAQAYVRKGNTAVRGCREGLCGPGNTPLTQAVPVVVLTKRQPKGPCGSRLRGA